VRVEQAVGLVQLLGALKKFLVCGLAYVGHPVPWATLWAAMKGDNHVIIVIDEVNHFPMAKSAMNMGKWLRYLTGHPRGTM
jgi:hypothetical protein